MKSTKLNEATRNALLRKSRNSRHYSGKDTGRWEAKTKCKVANTTQDYNKIDMDTLWKKDILNFAVKVQGETDNYVVTVEFSKILKRLQDNVKRNKYLFDQKAIYDALVAALNSSDVKVDCTCDDWKYRQAYFASKQGYKAGAAETRPSKITNPRDDLGAGCKHVVCVLNNAKWIKNISSVINNYVNYAKDHMENLYAKYIFPKIYNMDYNKAIQMTISDFKDNGEEKDDLDTSPEIINLSNALGKVRGRIQKGSNKNPAAKPKQ